MNILILTEMGKNIGMGHFGRCSALADGLIYHKHRVDFVVRGLPPGGDPFQEYNVSVLDWFNIDFLNQVLKKYPIAIIDSYNANMELLEHIANNCELPVFLIDSQLRFFPKGAVLFPSVYASNYANLRNKNFKLVAGREFILFGSKMWNMPKYKVRDVVGTIGISLGGYYNDELVSRICNTIRSAFPRVSIEIFGAGKAISSPENQINNHGLIDKKNYISQLLNIDIMFVSGGQSLNECLLIGIPSICIVVVDNQFENANGWQNLGVTNYLMIRDKSLSNSMLELLQRYREIAYRKLISTKAKKAVNANGAISAASSIIDIFHEQQAVNRQRTYLV
jgi:UDP-2,4-diacetamido-2,4,6-trideoxy-beta-L-altropyranose hydrolase